jgi:hypothetical protein
VGGISRDVGRMVDVWWNVLVDAVDEVNKLTVVCEMGSTVGRLVDSIGKELVRLPTVEEIGVGVEVSSLELDSVLLELLELLELLVLLVLLVLVVLVVLLVLLVLLVLVEELLELLEVLELLVLLELLELLVLLELLELLVLVEVLELLELVVVVVVRVDVELSVVTVVLVLVTLPVEVWRSSRIQRLMAGVWTGLAVAAANEVRQPAKGCPEYCAATAGMP